MGGTVFEVGLDANADFLAGRDAGSGLHFPVDYEDFAFSVRVGKERGTEGECGLLG